MNSLLTIIAVASFLVQLATAVEPDSDARIYGMKRLSGGGCPYTASWLANINLYRTVPWWMTSTKMEAASFNIFDRAKLKFQLSDPDAYFVHHMSMFEHLNHKKFGFDHARNQTVLLSRAAFAGECDQLRVSKTKQYVALIPFYGGLPPGVTKDLMVKSIGQGNSLVDGSTKALQAMATLCSCLKYYGRAVIGVARDEDKVLVNSLLAEMSSAVRHHTNVVQFKMDKPAHLPFHLLVWGQHYIRRHNCQQFFRPTQPLTPPVSLNRYLRDRNASTGARGLEAVETEEAVQKRIWQVPDETEYTLSIDESLIPADEEYQICRPGAVAGSHGGPVEVVYMKKLELPRAHGRPLAEYPPDTSESALTQPAEPLEAASPLEGAPVGKRCNCPCANSTNAGNGEARRALSTKPFQPIRFVYYSECDQVVFFDSLQTFQALSAASNESTFFVGRRKEKNRDSPPTDYMGGLDKWRECGAYGYSLRWPRDSVVQID